MKTNFITLLLLVFGINHIFSQNLLESVYEENHLLVHFDETVTPAEINELKNQLEAEEIWKSPLSDARYWFIPTDGQVATINGEDFIIDEITDALDGILKLSGSAGNENDGSEGVGLSYTSIVAPIESNISPAINLGCRNEVLDIFAPIGDNSVKIAVNDSGYNPSINQVPTVPYNPHVKSKTDHVEFKNKAIDHFGHGTHVLGIIDHVAEYEALNDTPFSYDIHRILNEEGNGTLSNLIYSVEQAIANGAQIINLSLGVISAENTNSFLDRMISKVEENNALLVIAAGNSDIDISWNQNHFPASFQSPNIITVASNNCRLEKSYFSNYGVTNVDITAPGEDIIGYDHQGQLVTMTGTSQATAIVTGIAAILASHQPNFSARQIKCAILAGADFSSNLNGLIFDSGIVNADGALNALLSGSCAALEGRNRQIVEHTTRVYPNPFDNIMYLESDSDIKSFTLTDARGKLILVQKFDNISKTQQIAPKENIESGIYFGTIESSDNTLKTIRVIKL